MARLHCIFYDNTLCHGSSLLKVGVTQIILAMLEQEQLGPGLLLDDPLAALRAWSRDPSLRTVARLASGSKYRAVDLQWRFFEEASRFAGRGRTDGVVPRAQEILRIWGDTLEKLESDPASLAPRLDWVLKRAILERAIRERGLQWDSPEVKLLDHLYSSLDPSEGLYWTYERLGIPERIASAAEIERFVHQPPEDTRAWTRAHLLRLAGPARVRSVDWDSIRFEVDSGSGWDYGRTCQLPDPLSFTKAWTGGILSGSRSLEEALDGLEASQRDEHAVKARRTGHEVS